jgi:hypothetical protein
LINIAHFQPFHYLPGWGVGGEKLKIKLNSAQLELDLGNKAGRFTVPASIF